MKEKMQILWNRLLIGYIQHKLLYFLVLILLLSTSGAFASWHNYYGQNRNDHTAKPSSEETNNEISSSNIAGSTDQSNSNTSAPVSNTKNSNSKVSGSSSGESSGTSAGNSGSNGVSSSSNTNSSGTSPESLSATVAFYADTQTDTIAENDSHKNTVNYILATGANPVFHAGDLMEDGTQASLDYFNDATSTLRAERTFYAAMGNNDRKIGDSGAPSPLYLANFTFPDNEQWYSVNIGNLHMVILDSAFSWASSSQRNWLLSDLQSAASQSRITGVMFHHPDFSNEISSYLIDNGADFVVAGHIHSYSHTTFGGVHLLTCTGQSSIGYFLTKVYSSYVILSVYNSNNSLVETINISNR